MTQEVKYPPHPKMTRDEMRSVKIKSGEHPKIIYWYSQEPNYSKIARFYKVGSKCIKCIIDPQYKQKRAEEHRLRTSYLWHNDKNFRIHSNKIRAENRRYRETRCPEYKLYQKQVAKIWAKTPEGIKSGRRASKLKRLREKILRETI